MGKHYSNHLSDLRVGRYEPGYVYLIYTGIDYKIGKAVNVRKRMNELRTEGIITKGAYLVKTIHCDYSYNLERQLHDLFEHRRITREFFALTEDEAGWIVNLPESLPHGLADDAPALPK
jgi:hypothetical protein